MSARRGTQPIDRLTLVFVALLLAIVLAHAGEVAAWPWLVAASALVVPLLALLRRAPADTRLMRFVGPGYPLILVTAFYTILGVVALDVAGAHDAVVQRWEAALFGGQVSVTWHQRMPNAILSFILHASYGLYYLIVAGIPIWFWLRRSRESFGRVVFAVALTYYVSYVIFGLFPVAGPRYFYGNATGPAAEVLPARLIRTLLETGSAYGTAFPSSHVAAAWCAVVAAWRDARRLALALAPVALGLALGTVYGQFHYGVDALAGGALGIVLFAASDPLRRLLALAGRQ